MYRWSAYECLVCHCWCSWCALLLTLCQHLFALVYVCSPSCPYTAVCPYTCPYMTVWVVICAQRWCFIVRRCGRPVRIGISIHLYAILGTMLLYLFWFQAPKTRRRRSSRGASKWMRMAASMAAQRRMAARERALCTGGVSPRRGLLRGWGGPSRVAPFGRANSAMLRKNL